MLAASVPALLLSTALQRWIRRPLGWLLALVVLLAPVLFLRVPDSSLLRDGSPAWLCAAGWLLGPVTVVLAFWRRRPTQPLLLVMGMLAGFCLQEYLLLPHLGWMLSLSLWVFGWGLLEWLPTREDPPAPAAWYAWPLVPLASAALAIILALLRPFLFQHLPGTYLGLRWMVLLILAGLVVGVLFGELLRWVGMRAWALLGLVLLPVSLWSSLRGLQALVQPTEPDSILTWLKVQGDAWQEYAIAGWALLGLPVVSFGLAWPVLSRTGRNALPLVLAGLAGGVYAVEVYGLNWLQESPSRALPHPRIFARQTTFVAFRDVAVNPNGLRTLYRGRSGLSVEDLSGWHAIGMERGENFARLETAEIEVLLAGGAQKQVTLIGHPSPQQRETLARSGVLMPKIASLLPTIESHDFRISEGDHLLSAVLEVAEASRGGILSQPALVEGSELLHTSTMLGLLCSKAGPRGNWWVFCELRGLTAEGVHTLLATWRSVAPDRPFVVLSDGYIGPILGLHLVGEAREPLPAELAELVLFAASAATAIVANLAPVHSLDRPVLRTQLALPGLQLLASRKALDALSTGLRLDSPALEGLLQGLGVHADAQIERSMVPFSLDRITIPAAEIDTYLKALSKDPECQPLKRQVLAVAQLLYDKDLYEEVLPVIEELLDYYPEEFALRLLSGQIFTDLLDHERALVEWEHALALRSEAEDLRVKLAKLYADLERWDEAIALLQEAWEIKADLGIAKGLGMVYLKLGDLRQARHFLEFALESAAKDPELLDAMHLLEEAEKELQDH
jgi:tetratricopeptide (TPR) repeat protein